MLPSVLKGIQSLLSGIQSTCWPCGALSHYRRGGYGLNCSGVGALPPFWGSSVRSANSCLGGVRGVSACILGRECLILDQDSSPVPLALEMGKCPITPWPSPSPAGHIASAKGCGCPVLTASRQGTQPSACPVPPAQPCPGFPAPHSLLAPCYCCLPPELSPLLGVRNLGGDPVNDYISQQPLRHTMVSQPASPSMHAVPMWGLGGLLPAPPPSPGPR